MLKFSGKGIHFMENENLHQLVEEHQRKLKRQKQELAKLRRDQRQMSKLLSLLEGLSSELDLTTLLQKIVVSAVELLDADSGAIGLVDEERHAVRHQALHNVPEALLDVDFTEGVGLSGQVFALKRPVIVKDYGSTMEIPIDDPRMRRIKASMGVPIWWQGHMIGVFSISSDQPDHVFGERDLDVLSLFAKHVAIAIENARLYAEAERLAHLDERNRIARELHDSVSQSLFTLVLMADALRGFLRTGHQEADSTAETLYQTARDTLAEMRALIYELRPAALEDEGLVTALRKLADTLKTRHGLSIVVHRNGIQHLTQRQETALFRIAQEALYNAVKHAQASQVTVELHLGTEEICLTITDNGVGLQSQHSTVVPPEGVGRSGIGFITMRERANQLGGHLIVSPAPDCGLQVQARIPLN
jgi:signal transduction histidine kinase